MYMLYHCFLEVDVSSEHSPPVLPPLQLPVDPPPDTVGTPLSTPTSPALSDDSDCLFRLDVDNVRSLLPQDITALPPVLKVANEGIQSLKIHKPTCFARISTFEKNKPPHLHVIVHT